VAVTDRAVDVVIIGAGIAGGSLGAVLARAGLEVLILERSTEHRDRVRGEYMHPWGVAEAQRIGLYDALIGAGANVLGRLVPYDETRTPAEAEAAALALGLLPGVDGPLGIGHPTACNAFDDVAVAAGASLCRGVTDVTIMPGRAPSVRFAVDGHEREVSARLVVGADGRESTVRRQLGLTEQATEPRTMGAGMLVEHADDWPATDMVIGTETDRNFLAFPQGDGRARLYLFYDIADKHRLAGADKQQRFLEGFRLGCFPGGEIFANATPAGPCAAMPMNDTWIDRPMADGVVLVGDAAGHSDPLIGAGLSVSLRDVRLVSDILLAGDDWSSAALEPYAHERAERMRRLRFFSDVITTQSTDFGPGRVERRRVVGERLASDPEFFMIQASVFCGPELAPPDLCEEVTRARLFAPA
jgi:2-polyprenyl-6-methoxyphenol hydroxylase-like FAD-dependent oxidoreductase